MTPCSEETARAAIERMLPAPVKILNLVEQKRVSAGPGPDYGEDPDRDDIDNDIAF